MSYILKQQLAARGNYGGNRAARDIKYLVYHYTANDGDTDEGNGNYFAQHIVRASAHYFVDDDSVTRSVPDLCIAWAVGGAKWSDCGQTGGGKFYGQATNANSISIEMCDTVHNGVHDFSAATTDNAAALGRELMAKYNIPISRVICHFDVNGKHCPGIAGWIGSDRSKWTAFKARLGDDDMSPQQIFDAYNAVAAKQPCPDWAKAELAEAVAMGITDGARPMQLIPRYQAAIMCKRAAQAAIKAAGK